VPVAVRNAHLVRRRMGSHDQPALVVDRPGRRGGQRGAVRARQRAGLGAVACVACVAGRAHRGGARRRRRVRVRAAGGTDLRAAPRRRAVRRGVEHGRPAARVGAGRTAAATARAAAERALRLPLTFIVLWLLLQWWPIVPRLDWQHIKDALKPLLLYPRWRPTTAI